MSILYDTNLYLSSIFDTFLYNNIIWNLLLETIKYQNCARHKTYPSASLRKKSEQAKRIYRVGNRDLTNRVLSSVGSWQIILILALIFCVDEKNIKKDYPSG